MTIVQVGFRDDRLELIAKHFSQWVSMGKMYSKMIGDHEITFKVTGMYTNELGEFFFALTEDTSWFKKSAIMLKLPLKDIIGTDVDECDADDSDGDDGLGAFSQDYFGW